MKPPDPLEVALAAQRPIPTDREELEIERLIPEHKRIITVEDHRRWIETGCPPHKDDADIDGLLHELRRGKEEA